MDHWQLYGRGGPQRHLLCSKALRPNFCSPPGTAPQSWLELTSKTVNAAGNYGIEPVNKLCDTFRYDSLLSRPRNAGTGPLRRFPSSSSLSSLLRLRNDSGMCPVTFGCAASERKVRNGQSPSSSGRVPERPTVEWLSTTALTRPVRVSQPT